jgi:TRAP-type C4-dicarboxylate transport system permease small subunit
MRNLFLLILLFFLAGSLHLGAQCSICTRTAQQMGERPAKALNAGIVYLAIAPLAIFGLLGYRWWKTNREA